MTNTKTLPLVSATLATVVLGLTASCATTSDLDKLRNELEQVRAEATRAQQGADDAAAAAGTAQTAADKASDTADRALRIAEEAQSCCTRNTRRMDRMFHESVLK